MGTLLKKKKQKKTRPGVPGSGESIRDREKHVYMTKRAKLLYSDWLRQRAFFLNFNNYPGQNYLILIARAEKILVSD